MPLLDLSEATEGSVFAPLPDGTYNCRIADATMLEFKAKPGSKLPDGTPQINVRFEVDKDEIPEPVEVEVTDEVTGKVKKEKHPYSSNVFSRYSIVKDKKYEHKGTMDNILYGFLKAVGYDVEEIKSGKFNFEVDDLKGRRCQVVVTQREFTQNGETKISNNVKYVKAAGESESGLL